MSNLVDHCKSCHTLEQSTSSKYGSKASSWTVWPDNEWISAPLLRYHRGYLAQNNLVHGAVLDFRVLRYHLNCCLLLIVEQQSFLLIGAFRRTRFPKVLYCSSPNNLLFITMHLHVFCLRRFPWLSNTSIKYLMILRFFIIIRIPMYSIKLLDYYLRLWFIIMWER